MKIELSYKVGASITRHIHSASSPKPKLMLATSWLDTVFLMPCLDMGNVSGELD